MEKIPAACAMEWSIELEKGLRSKNPANHRKAVEQIGSRLQEWTKEQNITVTIADMFGLVPGQDRTFANTILLRLADAFRCGNNNMRSCILKVFLSEFKHIRKEGKRYNGILAKQRVPNYVELLKRVKIVFDTGDTEAKALALRLFGCCADLAKDSVHIRHVILSSLQSSHVLEVQASIFAAGCFSLLSDDFAFITIEMLANIINSSQTSANVAFVAIRAFSKLQSSSSIANRAYKVGHKLLVVLLNDELKAEMLLSLSKLAFKSAILIRDQVHLILSFLSEETSLPVKAKALKCLYLLFGSGACHFAVDTVLLSTLFHVSMEKNFPLHVQCDALKVLCKVVGSGLSKQSFMDMTGYITQLLAMGSESQCTPNMKMNLGFQFLVDVLCSLKMMGGGQKHASHEKWLRKCFQLHGEPQAVSDEDDGIMQLVCKVTLLVIAHVINLLKKLITDSSEEVRHKGLMPCYEVREDCKSLLNLILRLIKTYPAASSVALNCIEHLIHALDDMNHVSMEDDAFDKSQDVSEADVGAAPSGPLESGKHVMYVELVLCIMRFTNACLCIIWDNNAIDNEVCEKVKLLMGCLQQSRSCNSVPYEYFRLCLHPCTVFYLCHFPRDSTEDLEKLRTGNKSSLCWLIREFESLKFIKTILHERNYWAGYRAGMYTCAEGLWYAAAFTFRKLIDRVQSGLLRCWLKCLLLLAGSESEIKLLLFPKVCTQLINSFEGENKCYEPSILEDIVQSINASSALHGCELKVAKIHSRICSAEETLDSVNESESLLNFQMWFLNLRGNFHGIVKEILELSNSYSFFVDNFSKDGGHEDVDTMDIRQCMLSLITDITNISLKLNKLCRDYDLLATSFMDMDCRSSRSLSETALISSLLAFCTAFTAHFPQSFVSENFISENLGKKPELLCTVVLKDLVGRLWGLDDNIALQLSQHLAASTKETNPLQPREQMNISSPIANVSSSVLQFSISAVLHIQEDAKGAKDEKTLFALLLRGLLLLSEITRRSLELPFQVPKYFFRVRPCIGAELFIMNADIRNRPELSIPHGSQLCLNICIQLKNFRKKQYHRGAKMYCILSATPSKLLSARALETNLHAWKSAEVADLSSKLLMFVKGNTGKAAQIDAEGRCGDDMITTYACFEPNEKGQGFTSCLLDVSLFPEGLYRIKWLASYVDHSCSYWNILPLKLGPLFTVRKH